MNDLKKVWKQLPPLARVGIGAGAGAVIFFIGRKIYKNFTEKIELKKEITQEKESLLPVNIVSNGQAVQTNINLSAIATAINDAINNNDFFGWTEDEERIITEIKKVPKAYIPQLRQLYSDKFKKSLQDDIISAVDEDEWMKIEHLFQ